MPLPQSWPEWLGFYLTGVVVFLLFCAGGKRIGPRRGWWFRFALLASTSWLVVVWIVFSFYWQLMVLGWKLLVKNKVTPTCE